MDTTEYEQLADNFQDHLIFCNKLTDEYETTLKRLEKQQMISTFKLEQLENKDREMEVRSRDLEDIIEKKDREIEGLTNELVELQNDYDNLSQDLWELETKLTLVLNEYNITSDDVDKLFSLANK